jgi:acyl-CoA thioesterase-2
VADPDDPLARLLARLALEAEASDVFVAAPVQAGRRLFGGLLAAQAALAAMRTAPGARLHSLHGYFLRPGRPAAALRCEVTRVRDGRRFATRRVLLRQLGEPVFEASCGFTADEQGAAHAHEPPLGPVPPPEGLPDWETLRAAETGEPPRPPDAMVVRVLEHSYDLQ